MAVKHHLGWCQCFEQVPQRLMQHVLKEPPTDAWLPLTDL